MSKLARKPIQIPEGVKVELKDTILEIEGPLGKLSQKIDPLIKIEINQNKIWVRRENDEKKSKALQGLHWALIRNAIVGVTKGFQKKLMLIGVGYGATLTGNTLSLKVGFSHPYEFELPKEVKAKIEKNIITISGIDKSLVGNVAAAIRRIRPPEPYKGKGIQYVGEQIRRKAGKAAIGVKK